MTWDAIVIGGGPNGLVAAAYLARTGRQVLLLERAAYDDGVRPDAGWVPEPVVRDLNLNGFGWTHPARDPWLTVALPDGGTLELRRDVAACAEAIRAISPRDGARWPEFARRMGRLAGFMERMYLAPPVDPTSRSARDLLELGTRAAQARRLGREGLTDLLRTLPMSVGDLLDDWFENDALKGALATIALRSMSQGPRSGGTAFGLLHHHVGSPAGVFDAGSGGVRAALLAAAQEHGVTLRRGVEVVRILVRGGRASGVVLAGGEEVRASTVLSGVDPRRTFLQLLDHDLLTPDFRRAVENIRFHGSRALVSLVLSRPPAFATICVSPGLEFLERAHDQAKYGRVSSRPMLEARFAGSDSGGRYLVAAFLQYAPYRLQDGPWGGEDRRRLGVFAVEALTAAVPALAGTVVEHAVLAPPDLESMFGITEGHLHHGELALDQVLFMRPVPGWAQYRTPVPGLYLCGSGAHPGGGIAGAAGYNAARAVLKAQ